MKRILSLFKTRSISIVCSLTLLVGLVVPAVSGTIVSASEPQQEGTFSTFYYTGFETGNTAKDKDGAGWAYLYSPASANYTTEKVHQGNNSLVYEFHNGWGTWKTGLPLKKGVKYTASFWYKSQKSTGNLLYCNVFTGDNEDTNKRTYVNSSTVWQQMKITFTAANDGDRFTFKFFSDTVQSYLYIDEVSIVPVMEVDTDTTGTNHGTVPTLSTQIKVENGKDTCHVATFTPGNAYTGYVFEKWVDANGEKVADQKNWTVTNPATNLKLKPIAVLKPSPTATLDFESVFNWNGPDYTWYTPTLDGYSSDNVHSGSNSIKIDITALKTYTSDYKLSANMQYKITFNYKTANLTNTADVLATKLDSDSTSSYEFISPSGSWKTITKTYTPTKDSYFQILFTNYNSCTVYIDDIKIEVVDNDYTVTVDPSIAEYITVSNTKPLKGSEFTVTVNRVNGAGNIFFGWQKDDTVTEADGYTVTMTADSDIVLDDSNLGIPVYTALYNTNYIGKCDIVDLVHTRIIADKDKFAPASDIDNDVDVDAADWQSIRSELLKN